LTLHQNIDTLFDGSSDDDAASEYDSEDDLGREREGGGGGTGKADPIELRYAV
jgi:hypothetical protein